MLKYLTTNEKGALPIIPVRKADRETWLERQPDELKRWVNSTGFDAAPGSVRLVAGADGTLERAIIGLVVLIAVLVDLVRRR